MVLPPWITTNLSVSLSVYDFVVEECRGQNNYLIIIMVSLSRSGSSDVEVNVLPATSLTFSSLINLHHLDLSRTRI